MTIAKLIDLLKTCDGYILIREPDGTLVEFHKGMTDADVQKHLETKASN